MNPTVLLFSSDHPPEPIAKLGFHLQFTEADRVRDLDQTTDHWVYFVSINLFENPLWRKLRVQLNQANRCFVVFGSHCSSAQIVEAMRDGSSDFLQTEDSTERWASATARAASLQRLWLQLYGGNQQSDFSLMIGNSNAMQTLTGSIRKIGPTPASVLIIGESGTGKEKTAQALHDASGLTGQFIPVNCAAIPKELIESELFGSEKGSYTGASHARKGLVEQAAGGTLFLDEIGELDLMLQPKLLRFLESRKARRIGAQTEYKVDARILSATNRDLENLIASNQFRADLYYRLSEIILQIPPLRDRLEDIPLLAMHFLNEANEKFGKHVVNIDPKLIQRMIRHSWPGNARELRAAIHRMVVLHDGPVLRSEWWDEPDSVLANTGATQVHAPNLIEPSAPIGFPQNLNRRQRWQRAAELLRQSGNDRTWTAAQLGVHPTTLFRWIQSGKVPESSN